MSKETDWFSSMAERRVTVTEIAEYLEISRRTATNRVSEGLTADEMIVISRAIGISPIHALVELGKITFAEAFDFVDGEGKLLATASTEELIAQLARENLSLTQLIDLGNDGRDRLAAMEKLRSNRKHLHAVSTPDDSMPESAVADDSPDEDEMRGDPFDD